MSSHYIFLFHEAIAVYNLVLNVNHSMVQKKEG